MLKTSISPARSSNRVSTDAPGAPRTLLISDRYLPDIGGSFTWFDNVYRRHRAGSVWIVTNRYPNAGDVDANFPQIRMVRTTLKRYRFLKPESLLLYMKLLFWCSWVILRHRIQVIHASKNMPEGYMARILSRIWRVPYVVYAHGEEITVFMRNPKLAPHQPKIYGDAAAVIANSGFTAGLVKDLGVPEDRIARISPGVDPDVFAPAPPSAAMRQKYGLDAGKIHVLTVGRLQRRKGHDRVIEAMPEILRQAPNVVYVIAGDGEERSSLEALARATGVAEHVRFLGRVPQEDLPALYNTCDLFLMANRTMPDGDVEGFGIVFLEAGACLRPAIAGNSGGTADAVEDGVNGFQVDGESLASISTAVVRLALDPALRQRMGEAGRKKVLERYTWDGITERIVAVSKGVVHGTNERKTRK